MKTTTTPATTPAAMPAFDKASATAVAKPYRHAASARTVGYHQSAGPGEVDLFGVNRAYIATVKDAEAAAKIPAPAAKPAATPAAS